MATTSRFGGFKWLSSPVSFRVQSPISILNEDARVKKLIIKQKGFWN